MSKGHAKSQDLLESIQLDKPYQWLWPLNIKFLILWQCVSRANCTVLTEVGGRVNLLSLPKRGQPLLWEGWMLQMGRKQRLSKAPWLPPRVAGPLFTMLHHNFVYAYIGYSLTVNGGCTFYTRKDIFLIVVFSACLRNTTDLLTKNDPSHQKAK